MIPFIDFDNDFLDTEALLFLSGASGGTGVEATATGNPLVFTTDLARPLKSLLIPFTPQQSGTGYPSPSNIRSIIPWNGLTVFGGGKNLLNVSEEGYIAFSWNRFLPNPFKKAGTYKVSCQRQFGGSSEYGCRLCISNVTNTAEIVGNALTAWGFGKGTLLTATVNVTEEQANGKYLKFEMHSAGATLEGLINAELQCEVGNVATAYEPYKPITETDIVFPSPVYGGTLDVVSGVLTVDFAVISKKWSDFEVKGSGYGFSSRTLHIEENVLDADHGGGIAGNHFCNCMIYSYATASAETNHYFINSSQTIAAYMAEGTSEDTEVLILAKLATPQEIQLTPAQITALVGDNTIWSDADGQMTAVYLKKG